MDLSQFLDVSCDVGEEPIIQAEDEEDIVLVDGPPAVAVKPRPNITNNKRALASGAAGKPPAKRARPAVRPGQLAAAQGRARQPAAAAGQKVVLTQQAVGILRNANLTVKKVAANGRPLPSPKAIKMKPSPKPLANNSITWKYRPLTENLYNGDIRKADLLKDYEPEQCMCKEPEEGELACGEGCVNRSTYTECDKELCKFGERCGNQKIQRREYAPGLERFMTQKKGWGVRARQAIASGVLILEYMGEMCSSAEFEKRMVTRYKGDTHHYCLALDSKTVIDAQRAGSECRFVNHSCEPNCEMEKWNVNGLSRMAVFAKRDILPGEEVTYDYNFSLFDSNKGQECKCGSSNCRGIIGGKGKDFLITVNEDGSAANSPVRRVSVATNPAVQVTADEKWFKAKVSEEEMAWIVKNAPKVQQLEAKTIKCTVCNECLNFKAPGQIQRHPELGVIMCNKCRKNYGKGGWERDPEGNDEFCRWCSQGGQIYLCDFCPKAFCNNCLKWNLGRKYVKSIEEEEKWKCLVCNPSAIRAHRADYWAIHQFIKSRDAKAAAKRSPVKPSAKNGSPVPAGSAIRKTPNGRPVPAIKPILNGSGGKVAANGGGGANPQAAAGKNKFIVRNGVRYLVKNGQGSAAPVRLVPAAIQPATTNGEPYKKHYVDTMLLEADRASNRLRSAINELRKSWYANKSRDAKTVALATKKIREALATATANLANTDSKVVGIFKSNMADGTNLDIIDPNVKEPPPAPAEPVVEAVESAPDLPLPVEEEEEEAANNRDTSAKEEGIHDMSVDELEVNGTAAGDKGTLDTVSPANEGTNEVSEAIVNADDDTDKPESVDDDECNKEKENRDPLANTDEVENVEEVGALEDDKMDDFETAVDKDGGEAAVENSATQDSAHAQINADEYKEDDAEMKVDNIDADNSSIQVNSIVKEDETEERDAEKFSGEVDSIIQRDEAEEGDENFSNEVNSIVKEEESEKGVALQPNKIDELTTEETETQQEMELNNTEIKEEDTKKEDEMSISEQNTKTDLEEPQIDDTANNASFNDNDKIIKENAVNTEKQPSEYPAECEATENISSKAEDNVSQETEDKNEESEDKSVIKSQQNIKDQIDTSTDEDKDETDKIEVDQSNVVESTEGQLKTIEFAMAEMEKSLQTSPTAAES